MDKRGIKINLTSEITRKRKLNPNELSPVKMAITIILFLKMKDSSTEMNTEKRSLYTMSGHVS